MSIKDETIIIVEIPHQGRPLVWHAEDKQHLIWKADEVAQDNLYTTWTAQEVANCWGEDDAPSELVAIIEQHGSAVEAKDPCDYDRGYYPPHAAPSAIEVAKEYIGHDLRACYFLTIEEANDALQNPPWAFSPEVNQALLQHLGEHHYLEEMEVEKIVEALEGLSKKEKLSALEDGEWLGNFSVNQEAIEGLYADIEDA